MLLGPTINRIGNGAKRTCSILAHRTSLLEKVKESSSFLPTLLYYGPYSCCCWFRLCTYSSARVDWSTQVCVRVSCCQECCQRRLKTNNYNTTKKFAERWRQKRFGEMSYLSEMSPPLRVWYVHSCSFVSKHERDTSLSETRRNYGLLLSFLIFNPVQFTLVHATHPLHRCRAASIASARCFLCV